MQALAFLPTLIPADGSLLWVLDEAETVSTSDFHSYKDRSTVLSNRFDIINKFSGIANKTILSDFEITSNDSYAAVIFPLSKEKLINHHVISLCCEYLQDNGKLILIGEKNLGIKTYFDRLKTGTTIRKNGSLYYGSVSRPASKMDQADAYRNSKLIENIGPFELYSKPGVFSWKQLDRGSLFLTRSLAEKGINFSTKTVLDLGCGSGHLALFAASLGARSIQATDNNVTAVAICNFNFERNKIEGHSLCSDCAQDIQDQFDVVLCNPPFHKGKNLDPDLTHKFLENGAKRLVPNGQAFYVVNAFIPIERLAKSYFSNCETLANDKHYKVVRLSAKPTV